MRRADAEKCFRENGGAGFGEPEFKAVSTTINCFLGGLFPSLAVMTEVAFFIPHFLPLALLRSTRQPPPQRDLLELLR